MAHAVSARLLIAGLVLGFLQSAPATAQTTVQQPPVPAGPVDPAEAGGTDIVPLRIGPVTLSGSAWVETNLLTDDERNTIENTFRIRRARIGLAGNLTPKVGWNISGEFTAEPTLRNAFLIFRFTNQLNVRVGQATPPTALERGTSPLVLELIDRSRLTVQLTPGLDTGVTILNAEPYRGWLTYAVSLYNGTGFNRSDNNDAKDTAGKLELTPPMVPGLSVVLSAARGAQPDGRRTRSGLGVEYDVPAYKVAVEGLRQGLGGRPDQDGFLVIGVYRIRPRQMMAHFRLLELVARYVVFNDPVGALGVPPGAPDEDSGGDSGPRGIVPITTRDVQAGANYYVNRNVRVMANLLVPTDRRDVGTTVMTRLQIVF